MNDLLKKDLQWLWGAAQKRSFAKFKQALVNATIILAFNDTCKPITVTTDGTGAVILQEEKN